MGEIETRTYLCSNHLAPDWTKPFEIMCDASGFAIGAVCGQHIDNKQHVIYYASRTLNDAQLNYTTTENEFLAVVFALEKILTIPTRIQNNCVHGSLRAKVSYGKEER